MSSFIEDLNFEGKATGVFSSLSACNLVQQSISVSCAVILKPTHPHLPGSLQNFQSRLHSPHYIFSATPTARKGSKKLTIQKWWHRCPTLLVCLLSWLLGAVWVRPPPRTTIIIIGQILFFIKSFVHMCCVCVLACCPSMSWRWTVIMQHTQFVLIWCQP